MPDSLPVGDLAAAVADALRGGRERLNDMVAGARQRAEDRAFDAFLSAQQPRSTATPLPSVSARPIPAPAADREFEVGFRNGRRARVTMTPALARRSDLAALARATAANDRATFAALRRHREVIDRLTKSNEELTRKVAALQAGADQAVIGLVQQFSGLDRRVKDVVTQVLAAPAVVAPPGPSTNDGRPRRPVPALRSRDELHALKEVQALTIRSRIQTVSSVVSTVQAAAYGQKGSLLAPNNLRLAANQLFWGGLEPVLSKLGLPGDWGLVVAAMAPLGGLITGEVLLGDQQHVRFVSGVAAFDGTSDTVRKSLRGPVAPALWAKFQRRTDVPVVITLLERDMKDSFFIDAQVIEGELIIRILAPTLAVFARRVPPVRVAWMIDTGADVG